jgi:hypothetical protein
MPDKVAVPRHGGVDARREGSDQVGVADSKRRVLKVASPNADEKKEKGRL